MLFHTVSHYCHCAHSMGQGLCNGTVSVRPSVCLSVCLSVCPIYQPLQQRAAGLLLWARRVGDIDRLLHGRAPQQMRAVSRCQLTQEAEYRLVLFYFIFCFIRRRISNEPVRKNGLSWIAFAGMLVTARITSFTVVNFISFTSSAVNNLYHNHSTRAT